MVDVKKEDMFNLEISFRRRLILFCLILTSLGCRAPFLNNPGDGSSESFRQTALLRCFLGETCRSSQNALPTISMISSFSGIEGETLTITGTNFSKIPSENSVTFSGDITASITSSSETSLTVLVPTGSKSGTITVKTNIGLATSTASYTVYRYFVYVPVGTAMEVYKLNLSNGSLTAVSNSSPFDSFRTVFFHPTGKFMYELKFQASSNVGRFTVDTATGIISTSNTTIVTANDRPVALDFHPSGKFLYVSNFGSRDVSAFSIHLTTGDLTKISDSATGCVTGNLASIRVTPDGKFVYVVRNGLCGNGIVQFSIDQTTGALTLIGNLFPVGNTFDSLLVNPSSTSVFAVNDTGAAGQVFSASINPSTGVLTTFGTYPSTIRNYRGAMHPSGNYLYTVNITNAPISLAKLNIATDGSLSVPSTLVFGTNLQFVSIDPTGRYGFINNGAATPNNNFYEFSIDQSTGAPTLLNGGAAYNVSGTSLVGNIVPIRIPQ